MFHWLFNLIVCHPTDFCWFVTVHPWLDTPIRTMTPWWLHGDISHLAGQSYPRHLWRATVGGGSASYPQPFCCGLNGCLHGSPLNITQPLGIWSIMATIRWCPIAPKWDIYQSLVYSWENQLHHLVIFDNIRNIHEINGALPGKSSVSMVHFCYMLNNQRVLRVLHCHVWFNGKSPVYGFSSCMKGLSIAGYPRW